MNRHSDVVPDAMVRHFPLTTLALTLALIASPPWVHAQQPDTPFMGSEAEGYPDGSRWPRARFEPLSGNAQLTGRAFGAMSAAEVGFSAAALVQGELPEGFTLRDGSATRVEIGPVAPAARISPAPADDTIDPEQAEVLDDTAAGRDAPTGADAPRGTDKWFISHGLTYRGVPLAKFSDVFTIIGADGQAQLVRKRNLPATVDATAPTITPEQAVEAAQGHAGGEFHALEPRLEIWVGPDQHGRLAWRVTLDSDSLTEPDGRRYWIAATGEPEVLHWERTIFHTHHGQVTGTPWIASPLGGTDNRPLQDLQVNRSSGGNAVTNSDGRYNFPSGGGNVTIDAALSGPNSVVQNQAGPGLTQSGSGSPAAPVDLHFGTSGEQDTAQVSAFYWTNQAHTLAETILDPADLPNLTTRVNINNSCNAFWNGNSINFFQAGGGCPNTAYSDVVYHEYGHGVDARKGGILDGGYSEGFGDALAILGTRQPCLGRDFLGAGTCLRPATDVILWPPAPGEGVHSIGRRYAGFTWELVQQLRQSYSEDGAFDLATRLVLAAAVANPSDIPDAVMLSFLADDNDGNLANGTPHFAELAAAADSRNIPRPADPVVGVGRLGFVWAHNPTAASYTPSATYAHNSAGGPITVTRSAAGQYAVRFAGLGGQGMAGGHVQVTAYGPGSEHCKVQSWGSFGADFVANVRCFTAAGASVDTRYTVLVRWP